MISDGCGKKLRLVNSSFSPTVQKRLGVEGAKGKLDPQEDEGRSGSSADHC